MIRNLLTSCTAVFLLSLIHQSLLAASLFGPTPYLSIADIPSGFYDGGFTELDNLEDGSLTTNISAAPNVTVIGPQDVPAMMVDSVDADDGSIDGHGFDGHSLFCSCGAEGITLTYPEGTVAAGLVWTDGEGTVTFEAFGPSGLLGSITASDFVDDTFLGTTGEDRFFGARDPGGITKLRISNTTMGIEIDHPQYEVIPEPSSAILASMCVGCVLTGLRRRIFF